MEKSTDGSVTLLLRLAIRATGPQKSVSGEVASSNLGQKRQGVFVWFQSRADTAMPPTAELVLQIFNAPRDLATLGD